MTRNFKTPAKCRANYRYYDEDGRVTATIKPDKDGVTSFHISALHHDDDDQYDESRRYEYGIDRFPEKHGKDGSILLDDEQPYLADYDADPERLVIAAEDDDEHNRKHNILSEAMKTLTEKEYDIFWAYAVKDMSFTEIGKINNCSCQAVTQRIENIKKRLQKFF